MKIGLSKSDITPPVGCELAGFGHYLGRQSNAVFDPLYASALQRCLFPVICCW